MDPTFTIRVFEELTTLADDNITRGHGVYETRPLVSDFTRSMFILVNHVVISTGFDLFGTVGNIINIAVFLKQGLRKSMNLSFFAMSISDLCGLVFQIWHNFCLNPYVEGIDSPVEFIEVQYLTAGWPNAVLVRITCWITAYITAERCLSIAIPLKIKQVITFNRTAVIIVFIYLINMASIVPLYFSAYFSWNFYPEQNKTKLGISFRSNKLEIESLIFTFQASLAIIAFALVIIFTGVLVIKLKQKSKWRRTATSDKDQNEAMSSRERKTVNMVIAVAIVLIVCYTPAVICSITTSITPDFGITGKQANMFHVIWSFGFLFHSINASINVVLYYKMSSKYRTTFHQIFRKCAGKPADDTEEDRGNSCKTSQTTLYSVNQEVVVTS
uniref:G-protein coupled receptors family 1 profile domain-containing protein n=1 Tax=Biomphalaria glabrata TaxID=6526 RepID=A0A2C9KX11_BIOGL